MTFKDVLIRKMEDEMLMRKLAAAVLTPEAEQAAVQAGMDPAMAGGAPPQGGMPADPSMAAGGAPMDPSMMQGGAPMGAPQGSGGGQLPPEILQDQGFMQWLQQMGIMFDQQTGMFIDPQGQPLPAEVIMEAYQQYQAEMQGAAPQGGAPMDPSMMQGGMPADPSMAAGGAPMDPLMAGGMPSQGAPMDPAMAQGDGLPPEIMQDQGFLQFMEQALGVPLDPNSGMFMDPQSGQPIPPEMIMQAYEAYQQQAQGGATADPNAPQQGAPADAATAQGGAEIPPEVLEQIQSVVDASIQNFSSQLDKKIETLLDKLDTVKMALEAMRDTDDARDKQDKETTKALQDEIAAELNPTTKTASIKKVDQELKPKPINMFEFIMNNKK